MTWGGFGPSGLFITPNGNRLDWEPPGGDVSGVIDNLIVVGIQNFPIANTSPISGYILAWNGTSWSPTSPVALSGISPHELLSTAHSDTIIGIPASGDIIVASGVPPAWRQFSVGLPGQFLGVTDIGVVGWTELKVEVISSGAILNLSDTSRRVIIKKTAGSPTSVNLPNSPRYGQEITIKDGKGDVSTNPITIVAQSGSLIDGWSYIVMGQNHQSFSMIFDGADWNII